MNPYAKNVKDMTGQTFGRLTVLRFIGTAKSNAIWECLCECGALFNARGVGLRSGGILSCGCLQRDKAAALCVSRSKHGMTATRSFETWGRMLARCSNPKNKDWKYYGGKGITVCERWREAFLNFHADMGDPTPGMSIDRINSDGNYEPGNCKWSDVTEQSRNRRIVHRLTAHGETLTIVEWSERIGVTSTALYQRIKAGWPIERAIPQSRVTA